MGGSDERQYNSPNIDLPVGQLGRTIYEEHPEYHNSLDNKEFMKLSQLELSCKKIFGYLNEIEKLNIYQNTNGYGESFLSKHNLYPTINSNTTRTENSGDALKDGKKQQKTVMYILSYSDGLNSTEDIAMLLEEDLDYVNEVAKILEDRKLISKI
jgi:aminopeptidase-like protein